jgi:hypothetical protein
MRQLRNWLGRRLPAAGDDAGVTLLLVLLIVTTIGLVSGAMLSLETTGIRTTIALRDQGASAYAADGAAQVAISKLESATSAGTTCTAGIPLGTSTNVFYTTPAPSSAAAFNAYVSCAAGAGGTGGPTSPNASPGNALLTLGDGKDGEDGVLVSSGSGSGAVDIRGGIFSNSDINLESRNYGADGGYVTNTATSSYTFARGTCNTSRISHTSQTSSPPTCSYSAPDTRGSDPGTLTPHGATYNTPAVAPANGTIGSCDKNATYQTVTPGRFTSAAALDALTGCTQNLVNFTPGTYYFDFHDSGKNSTHVWNIQDTFIIAGKSTLALTSTPSATQMPTACLLPTAPTASNATGVMFVFGGDSQVVVQNSKNGRGNDGFLTICASKSDNGPPIAVYGLKTALGGSYPVSAQSGCITNPPPQSNQCALITTSTDTTALTIQGTVYVPLAGVVLILNDSTGPILRWGLIARTLIVVTLGGNLAANVIDIPDSAADPTPIPDLMYLNVFVCPGTSTCTASGTLRLRAKVKLSSATPRVATVLSWSTQR